MQNIFALHFCIDANVKIICICIFTSMYFFGFASHFCILHQQKYFCLRPSVVSGIHTHGLLIHNLVIMILISDDSDAAFGVLANTEPAQCYRRLICDLATGAMPKSENDVIVSLFNRDASIESPKFEFVTAAKLGKQVKNVQLCELRYSCPLTGEQIQNLFKN